MRVVHGAGTLTVGAGVTNGDLHPMLEDRGMFVPTGRCPTVGVAGLVLGGGIGFSDKMFGLTCDRLVSTTRVNRTYDPTNFFSYPQAIGT
ncbi:FAD-binding protein [Streptomyces antimycoticus]